MHRELRALGIIISRKTAAKAIRHAGLHGRRKRRFKRTTDNRHPNPIAPNLFNRNLRVDAPDRVWVTAVTAIATWDGWLYPAAILDLYARRVVAWAAWATSSHNDTALALAAPDKDGSTLWPGSRSRGASRGDEWQHS